MTPTTTPPRDLPIRSDYELDDVDSRNLIETWEKAVAEAALPKLKQPPARCRQTTPDREQEKAQ